jgi:hypothetical protein
MFPPEEHAKVSPSKLQRIVDCPGSFQLTQSMESQQSVYAAEGTLLHLAVEVYLKKNKLDLSRLNEGIPADIVNPSLDREQQNAVIDCLVYLRDILRTIEGPYEVLIEQRVYLKGYSEWLYECDGTCDIIIVSTDTIRVIDWKFGKGIAVYAKDNDQLYAYSAGAYAEYQSQQIDTIETHVVQPRLDNYDVYILTPDDLHTWLNMRVIPGVTRAYSKHPPFNPGQKQCRWCSASTRCRARHNFATQTAADIFGAHQKLPNEISLEDVAAILERAPVLESYIKDLRVYAQRKLEQGIPVPGWKMVRGRSIRTWFDPELAEEYLGDVLDFEDIYSQKLISPAQAEKLNRELRVNEQFQNLVYKPEGKPTMVKDSDGRKPIDYKSASEKFQEVL